MTESAENTVAENTLLTIAEALDAAGVPRTDTERDGVGINLELGFAARIRWLVEDRDAKELAHGREANRWSGEARKLHVERDDAVAERDAARKACEDNRRQRNEAADAIAAETKRANALLAERDQLRRMHDGVSEDLHRERLARQDEASTAAQRELKLTEERDLAALTKLCDEAQRDRDFFKREASDAGRELKELRAELIKTLESEGSGVRFALTSESRVARYKADIVVDAKNGAVVKNTLGGIYGAKPIPGTTRKPARKPRKKKRKTS